MTLFIILTKYIIDGYEVTILKENRHARLENIFIEDLLHDSLAFVHYHLYYFQG